LEDILLVNHQDIVDGVIVVAWPLSKDIGEFLSSDVIFSNGIHAFPHIAASQSADSSPVIIIGLCNKPLLLAKNVNVSSAESVSCDNSALVCLITGKGIVGWGNLGSS
jgi:hypothetical protein